MPAPLAERVWRVRKNHTWIDAQIREYPPSPEVEIQFSYDGVPVVSRRWPSREAALACAADRLSELQRAGWVTHW
jgi:hypothetical protein